MNGRELYERARAGGPAVAGYYNDNIRVSTPDGPVIVRIPIDGAATMDLRPWREDRVLAAIAPHIRDAPRLLFASRQPPFQIHEFIAGDVLDDVTPRGAAVPLHVLDDVVRLFTRLTRVSRLPDAPANWPSDGDTTAFARQLSGLTQRVFDTYGCDCAALFAALAIPAAPLAPVDAPWSRLTRRPFTCVHTDVHRRNIIISDGSSTFLDWELTLWGDPVYDLAVHIHKMDYLPDERDALLTQWLAAMPPAYTIGWEHDLDAYLTHEQIKSAIVDSVRCSQILARGGPWPCSKHQLVASMTATINTARSHWNNPDRIDPARVAAALNLC